MRPTLNVISPELCARVVLEAKRILAEIRPRNPRAEVARSACSITGCKTDADGVRVLFPPEVVDRALATAPKSFTLYNRDGQPHAELGGHNVHYVPGSSGLKILDHRTGETRLTDSTDFIEYARLCDGLSTSPTSRPPSRPTRTSNRR